MLKWVVFIMIDLIASTELAYNCSSHVIKKINQFREKGHFFKLPLELEIDVNSSQIAEDLAKMKESKPDFDCQDYDMQMPRDNNFVIFNDCVMITPNGGEGHINVNMDRSSTELVKFWSQNMSEFYKYPGEGIRLGEGCNTDRINLRKRERYLTVFAKMMLAISCSCLGADDGIIADGAQKRVFIVCIMQKNYYKENLGKATEKSVFDYKRFLHIQETTNRSAGLCPTVENFNQQMIDKLNEIRGLDRAFHHDSVNPKLLQVAQQVLFKLPDDCELTYQPQPYAAAVFCLHATFEDGPNNRMAMNMAMEKWLKDIRFFK